MPPPVPPALDEGRLPARPDAVPVGEACAQVVANHGPLVLAACRRILRDEAQAQDAAQETFLLWVRKADRLPRHTSLPGWLYQAACRVALNHHRANKRRRARERSPDAGLHLAPGQEGPPWSMLEPWLEPAMETLPARQRDLVVQCYFQNQPQKAAAAAIGISESMASRELGAALHSLRRFFEKRGLVVGGTALVTLLGASAANAAHTATTPALLAGVLAASKAAPASMAWLPALTTMKLKISLVLIPLLLLGASAYDLASENSRLARWLGFAPEAPPPTGAKATAPQRPAAGDKTGLTNAEARWLQEARDIWSQTVAVDEVAFERTLSKFLSSPSSEERYQLLRASGISITRAGFDTCVSTAKPGKGAFDTAWNLWTAVFEQWIEEDFRQPLAWSLKLKGRRPGDLTQLDMLLSHGVARLQAAPGPWKALVETSPDPRLAVHAEAWLREARSPGSIWAVAAAAGISPSALESHVSQLVEKSPPKQALASLRLCANLKLRGKAARGLAPKLDMEDLRQLALQDLPHDKALSNLLLAMTGEPLTSFAEAINHALESTRPQGYDRQTEEWTRACAARVFAAWLKKDAAEALAHLTTTNQQEYLEDCMAEGVRLSGLGEQTVDEALAGSTADRRDAALTALYQAQSGRKPMDTLARIIHSSLIEDQVKAAKPVLKSWARTTPAEAAAWVAALPAEAAHAELAAVVASIWVDEEPAKAVAFAQEQGLRLDHGFKGALAFGIRDNSDSEIRSTFAVYRDEAGYNSLVMMTAGYRLPSSPKEAFAFAAMHAGPGWEREATTLVKGWLSGTDNRAEDFAMALPALNLKNVPAQDVTEISWRLAQRLARQDKVGQAMDWTLKLPPELAADARTEIVARLPIPTAAQQAQLPQWLSRATIPAQERDQLLSAWAQRVAGGP